MEKSRFVKESLILMPRKGKVLVWDDMVRWSNTYPGVVYSSLVVADAEVSLEKGLGNPNLLLNVHPYYLNEYVYPSVFYDDEQKPTFVAKKHKDERRWWENFWGLISLETRKPYNTPIRDKVYPVEFFGHQVGRGGEEEDNPLRSVVEELIDREEDSEKVEVPQGKVEEFISHLLLTEEGQRVYDFVEKLVLISPKAMVYRNSKGEVLAKEGDYGEWAMVYLGKYSHTDLTLNTWLYKDKNKEPTIQVHRLMTKSGFLFCASKRATRWTRIWTLVLVPQGTTLEAYVQNPTLVLEQGVRS